MLVASDLGDALSDGDQRPRLAYTQGVALYLLKPSERRLVLDGLRELRTGLGWTQEKLGDESGVNAATINQIERGRRSPKVATLERLAAAMGAEVADFFPKAQGALFSPDDSLVGRGADEAAAEPLRVLNECLYGMQQAYAPGRELNWSRETLEDVSALVAKTAVRLADAGFAAGGNDSFVEAVQIIGRARHVMQLLDERAADAPSQTTGPPLENVVEIREKLQQCVPERRAG